MKIFSNEESKINLGESLTELLKNNRIPDGLNNYIFETPSDANKRTFLAKFITAQLPEKNIVMDITAWGIWESGENWDLFNAYRKSLGEQRKIDDAHIHLFEISDKEKMTSILNMALLFLWDSIICTLDKDIIIKTNHDEFIEISGTDQIFVKSLAESLIKSGIKQISHKE